MDYIAHVNGFLDTIILKNSIKDYLQFSLTLFGLLLILSLSKRFLVKYIGNLVKRTANDFDDFLVSLIGSVGLSVFFVISLYFASLPLVLAESVRVCIRYAMIIVVTIRGILTVQAMIHYGINKAYHLRMKADDPTLNLIVKSVTGIVQWCVWGFGIIFILDNMGVNISTFVAGIGIGGIAVAMASQAILGDAFSALCIFLDKPFEIGDFIILDGNYLGSVEHIGIKTTRIRSLSGEELIFANSDLTKSRIKNCKRMETRRVEFRFQVDHQTSLENVRKIPPIITAIISNSKDLSLERVHFVSIGDYALIFEVAYRVNSPDFNVYMDRQQDINLQMMKKFESENILFAYPTQQLYLKRELQMSHPIPK